MSEVPLYSSFNPLVYRLELSLRSSWPCDQPTVPPPPKKNRVLGSQRSCVPYVQNTEGLWVSGRRAANGEGYELHTVDVFIEVPQTCQNRRPQTDGLGRKLPESILRVIVRGYLAHTKLPHPIAPPYEPRCSPTVGS